MQPHKDMEPMELILILSYTVKITPNFKASSHQPDMHMKAKQEASVPWILFTFQRKNLSISSIQYPADFDSPPEYLT